MIVVVARLSDGVAHDRVFVEGLADYVEGGRFVCSVDGFECHKASVRMTTERCRGVKTTDPECRFPIGVEVLNRAIHDCRSSRQS